MAVTKLLFLLSGQPSGTWIGEEKKNLGNGWSYHMEREGLENGRGWRRSGWLLLVVVSTSFLEGSLHHFIIHICASPSPWFFLFTFFWFSSQYIKDENRIKNAFALVACWLHTFNLYFPPRQTLLSFSPFFYLLFFSWGRNLHSPCSRYHSHVLFLWFFVSSFYNMFFKKRGK